MDTISDTEKYVVASRNFRRNPTVNFGVLLDSYLVIVETKIGHQKESERAAGTCGDRSSCQASAEVGVRLQ